MEIQLQVQAMHHRSTKIRGTYANTPLSQIDPVKLMKSMAFHETGWIAPTNMGGSTTGQTFQQYLDAAQQKAGMSFTPEKVAQLQQEFNITIISIEYNSCNWSNRRQWE